MSLITCARKDFHARSGDYSRASNFFESNLSPQTPATDFVSQKVYFPCNPVEKKPF